jgi:hypothetical protein
MAEAPPKVPRVASIECGTHDTYPDYLAVAARVHTTKPFGIYYFTRPGLLTDTSTAVQVLAHEHEVFVHKLAKFPRDAPAGRSRAAMKVSNAAKLCDERGFPWCFRWTGPGMGRLDLDITTMDGVFSLPVQGYCDGDAGNVNGEVLTAVLTRAKPPSSSCPVPR